MSTDTVPAKAVQRGPTKLNTRRYICRMKPNPVRAQFCTIGGVSFEEYRLKTFGNSEGRRPPMSVTPTHELTDAQAARVLDMIPRCILRPNVGVVKPTRGSTDPKTGRTVDGEEVQVQEGDIELAPYVEFFVVEDDATIATLKDELRQKQAELDAYRAKEVKDAEADNEDEAEEAGARSVGPRNKGGRPRKSREKGPREPKAVAETAAPTEPEAPYDPS